MDWLIDRLERITYLDNIGPDHLVSRLAVLVQQPMFNVLAGKLGRELELVQVALQQTLDSTHVLELHLAQAASGGLVGHGVFPYLIGRLAVRRERAEADLP